MNQSRISKILRTQTGTSRQKAYCRWTLGCPCVWAPGREGVWGSGGIPLRILNLGTGSR